MSRTYYYVIHPIEALCSVCHDEIRNNELCYQNTNNLKLYCKLCFLSKDNVKVNEVKVKYTTSKDRVIDMKKEQIEKLDEKVSAYDQVMDAIDAVVLDFDQGNDVFLKRVHRTIKQEILRVEGMANTLVEHVKLLEKVSDSAVRKIKREATESSDQAVKKIKREEV